MSTSRHLILSALFLFPVISLAGPKPDLVTAIDRIAKARATRLRIPGGAFGLMVDGKVALKRVAGVRRSTDKAAVTSETMFQVGSIAKIFTAMIAVKLQLQKKLRLDDPIAKYLPERCAGGHCDGITIAHLLSHTSGIPAATTNAGIENGESYDSVISRALGAKKDCAPAGCFEYNNGAYELTREVLEKVATRPYLDILGKELLAPLKIEQVSATLADLKKTGDYYFPHLLQKQRFVPTEHSTAYYGYPGAGGLNANLDEMLKLVSAELGNQPEVVSAEALALLHEPKHEAPDVYAWFDDVVARKDVKSSYALGHRVLNYPDLKVVFHTGWVKGCKSLLAVFPERKMGMVLLQNSDSELGFRVLEDVIRLLRAK